jgi:pSer/pThr/pTyr-binding forkhead associated (FHA) protein
MIEIILLAGRILLVALLFCFLFAVMQTGVGQVKGLNRRGQHWTVSVVSGPKEVKGLKMAIAGPIVLGRAPGADILVNAAYVSGRHARFSPLNSELLVEDLGSTNGTLVNDVRIESPQQLLDGDIVTIGDVVLKVNQA